MRLIYPPRRRCEAKQRLQPHDGNGVAAAVSDTKMPGEVSRRVASLMTMEPVWVRLVWPKAEAAVKKDAAPPVAQRNILRALLVLKFIGLTMFSSLNY